MKLLYEPWGLGDACIAASVAIHSSDTSLACRSAWHPVIAAATKRRGISLPLVEVTTKYGVRFLEQNAKTGSHSPMLSYTEVYSVRGDFRDYLQARKIFPGAKIKMKGWVIWFARRFFLIDFILKKTTSVTPRYDQWACLTRVNPEWLKPSAPWPEEIRTVGIHIGAQWRSKQYPYVAELKKILEKMGVSVVVLAGSGDLLPEALIESDVCRLKGAELITKMSEMDLMITNDSGPMHACYLADIPFFAIFGTANAKEWAPPKAKYLAAEFMPSGYKSTALYASDRVLKGWPLAQRVVSELFNSLTIRDI